MIVRKRNGTIDILKLVIMLINIMGGHFVISGAIKSPYPFSGNGIFVEFFLIITGYYTMLHFSINDNVDYFWGIIGYTLHKFSKFFPYILVMNILLLFTLYGGNININDVYNLILDSFLIKEAVVGDGLINGALWMLSAMFIIFPLFCGFCLIKKKHIQLLLSLYIPIV